jgi:hypothetical protein
MRVAAFGDAALSPLATGRVLGGDEPEVGHEFFRVVEALEIANFADQYHPGRALESAKSHQCLHERPPLPGFNPSFLNGRLKTAKSHFLPWFLTGRIL